MFMSQKRAESLTASKHLEFTDPTCRRLFLEHIPAVSSALWEEPGVGENRKPGGFGFLMVFWWFLVSFMSSAALKRFRWRCLWSVLMCFPVWFRVALETLDRLTESLDFTDYASRIIHPIVRTLDSTPELRSTSMDTLSSLVFQLGKKVGILVPGAPPPLLSSAVIQ